MELILKYAVDGVLVVVFLSTVLNSARRGFVRCVLSLVCVAVALVAALNFSQPAAEWSYDNLFSAPIEQKVAQALEEGFNSETAAQTVIQTIEMIPEVLTSQLTEFGIDVEALSEQIASLKLTPDDTAHKISVQIIRPGALVLLKLICYIIIFVAVRFVLGLLIGLVSRLPAPRIIHKADKWLGGVLGVVKGAVLVMVLCLLLNALLGLIAHESEVYAVIDSSVICRAVSNLGAPDLSAINIEL